jgi:TDG/mug DNA glycosylase family protein
VERRTVDIYETQAAEWIASRAAPRRVDGAERLAAEARAVHPELPVLDVGCGPGGHFAALGGGGSGVVGLDAARALLAHARSTQSESGSGALVVQADLLGLPLRRLAAGGAWARMSYHHVPRAQLPMALADLHRVLAVGAPLAFVSQAGTDEGATGADDEFPGRYFACWQPEPLTDVLVGAGFDVRSAEVDGDEVVAWATRARTLADTVGPDMRLLICGLNPSVYSADRGYGFARRTNRFWPAMVAAGLVPSADAAAWSPRLLLARHGIGMTDLVKRATVASAELTADEYCAGVERVRRLVSWLRPGAVCFVGLEGWRTAVDRRASAGWQADGFGGVPAYVMPSTSGRVPGGVAAPAVHLRAAAPP